MKTFLYQIVHHSADTQSTPQFSKVDTFHKSKGWKEIGYNRFIEKNGLLKYGRSLEKNGAHTKNEYGPKTKKGKLYDLNSVGIGYCLAGDFTKELPTNSQIKTLHDIALMDAWTFGIPLENRLLHWQVKNTACPGVDIWEMVAEYHKEYLRKRLERAKRATHFASSERYNKLIRLIERLKRIIFPTQ